MNRLRACGYKLRSRPIKHSLLLGVYYRLPDQGEPVDKAFLLQPQEASRSQVVMVNFISDGEFQPFRV